MNNQNALALHLHVPLPRDEADAYGMQHDLSQLIIEGNSDALQPRLASVLAALLAQEPDVYLLVIGAFESTETTSGRLGAAPVGIIGGMTLFQVNGIATIASRIIGIEAEELALFGCAASHLTDYISRVEGQQAKWWKLSSGTLRGALTAAPDLVDRVAFYAKSHGSIELLGTRVVIERSAELARTLV